MRKIPRLLKCSIYGLLILAFIGSNQLLSASNLTSGTDASQSRTINSWLDFPFDSNQPMGDARNPVVILPANLANVLGDLPAAKHFGELTLIPATEFQRATKQPLMAMLLAPFLKQLGNVKSFDGFAAIDMTGMLMNLPSHLIESTDKLAGRLTAEEIERTRKLLRNGDIVLGSHVVNYMTWGRFNHAAIVVDAERGIVAESTAKLPTDKPGVRRVDWSSFAAGYVHVGVVRVRGVSADQISRVARWIGDRYGKPYRWPIIQGLDKTDQSRFYCSQLVWLAYRDVLNIDLDEDQGVLVFPDDLYNAKNFVETIVP